MTAIIKWIYFTIYLKIDYEWKNIINSDAVCLRTIGISPLPTRDSTR